MTSLPITYAEDEPAMTNDPDSVHPSAADAVAVSGSDVPARPTSLAEGPITPEMVEQAAQSVFEFKPWPGHLYRFAGALNALLAAQEQGAVPQWMPMDSAPRDGTRFNARCDWLPEIVRETSWSALFPDASVTGWLCHDDPGDPMLWNPTQWMPLSPVADPRQAGKGETK